MSNERWFFPVKSRSRIALASIVAASALLLTSCTSSEAKPIDDHAESLGKDQAGLVTDAVQNAMALSGSTQAVVGVWSADGDLVRAYASEGADDNFDANALLRGAQTTQPVMCALLLDLVDEGKVSLNREVAQDLPRQTGIGDITYGQLCDGTSGLADFKKEYTGLYITNPERNWSTGEKIAESLILGELPWPGENVYRSDANAVLLGRALKIVGNESIAHQLEERVFNPAEMNSSVFLNDGEDFALPGTNTLTGLAYLPGPQCDVDPVDVSEQSPSILGAAGATATTVGDIKRFYERYLDGGYGGKNASIITETKPLKNPDRNDDGEPTTDPDTAGPQLGFGVVNIGPLWGSDGALPGSITSAWHNPETGFSVVVALNNSTAGAQFATTLARQIAALLGESGDAWSADDMAASLSEQQVCAPKAE
ncbi:serine hydrolase domain-containing protein [Leucobacter chinensis]|uniref:serine hydrolase domain-containing protein n=1 Tax=Leucobacter chinensis TaxID=2851010 RepID=UPI001C224660|nr:serine hydrolase [Leucobacter chinensis]